MRKISALLFLQLLTLLPLSADSSGILKTRIFEQEDGTLLLEVDAPAIQEGSLATPVFPARYRLDDRFREEHLDLLTLGYQARPYARGGFSSRDILRLPWAVNGISLTVFRRDGSVNRSLYKRGLTGISIPMVRILPEKMTLREALRGWMQRLLKERIMVIPLLLLALILGAFQAPGSIPVLWLVYFGCSALALPFAEAGLGTPLLLFSGLLVLFLVLYLALRLRSYGPEEGVLSFFNLSILLGVTGFLTGLFAYGEIANYAGDAAQTAAFYGLTLVIFSIAAVLVSLSVSFILILTGGSMILRTVFLYISAVSSVFLILLIYWAPVSSGETAVLGADTKLSAESPDGASIVLSQNSGSVLSYPDSPLSLFIAMDPYELRLETLVHLSSLIPADNTLPIDEQPAFLDTLEEEFLKELSVHIDGNESSALRVEASFVQIMNNGLTLRSEAVEERADEGLVGITLVFGCDDIPRSLDLAWNFFPSGIEDLPVRMAAPWENRAYVLSTDDRKISWMTNTEYSLSPSAVPSAGIKVPVISVLLFFLCIIIPVFGRGRGLSILPLLLLTALLLYPRIRVTVPGPLRLSAGSDENLVLILDGLLGNLYRSFELRDDGMVYDRLALSVEGEFLQDVFLQNRRAMVLEERGGARARVEDVTMISSSLEGKSENGGILVNAEWTVSGAVSHFGHTHYRRNRYQGDITLVKSDDNWKIWDISLKMEEREL